MQNNQQRRQPAKRITPGAIGIVVLLMILPGAAAFRLCPPLDFRWVLGYWLGWAAAFLAQREFRHKISKRSYQWAFWTIVVFYQLLAGDFLLNRMMSRAVLRLVAG
ncbi:MAG: hypothetical protein EOP84_33680 [Verrucomicrobiaceae bacterium]|nr:MAG: hypothetical protein EOP84_33680 [Verrucomicrobiaceae bacterium]